MISEKHKAICKAYREHNKDKIKAKRDAKKAADGDKIAAYNKEYYEKHKDEYLQRSKEQRRDKKEEIKIYLHEYYITNPEKIMSNSRKHHLRKAYNMTEGDYEALLEKQKHRCASCSVTQIEINAKLVIDHCHSSGRIRGLLCRECNLGIGGLGDNLKGVLQGALYLAQFNKSDLESTRELLQLIIEELGKPEEQK